MGTFAAHWGPEALLTAGNSLRASTPYTVMNGGTNTPATLWTTRVKATPQSNPGLSTTSSGNAEFFPDVAGFYDLWIGGALVLSNLIAYPDPEDSTITSGFYAVDTLTFRPPPTITGRQWTTNFDSARAAQDNSVWTMTNLTRTTDSGRPAARMTDLSVVASCMTKETVRDVDVLIRWRLADTDSTYHLAFAQAAAHARRVGNGDRISLDYDIWHSGVYPVALTNAANSTIGSSITGGFSPAVTSGTVNTSNVTDDRWLRIRVIGGVVMTKHWLTTVSEPNWQVIRLAREANSPSGDNLEAGLAGAEMLFNGGLIYEVTVTELLASSEMAVLGRMSLIDSNSTLPVNWTKHGAMGSGTATLDAPSIVDPWGTTRPVLHIAKPSADGYDGFQHRIINSRRRGRVYPGTRRSAEPHAPFPTMVRVSIWSKALSIVNASPSAVKLGGAIVLYYYDANGGRNQFDSQYYRALGPTVVANPPVGGTASGPGGIGSWGWFETSWVMPIYGYDDILWTDVFVGIHDPGSTGELWVVDLSLVPVLS